MGFYTLAFVCGVIGIFGLVASAFALFDIIADARRDSSSTRK